MLTCARPACLRACISARSFWGWLLFQKLGYSSSNVLIDCVVEVNQNNLRRCYHAYQVEAMVVLSLMVSTTASFVLTRVRRNSLRFYKKLRQPDGLCLPASNLHGQILLAGGLTSDHVLINLFGTNTLDVNTNGLSTFGTFLDPNGTMSAVHTDIEGRWFGGDSSNQQIVSGAFITAPQGQVPDAGSTLALLSFASLGLVALRRKLRC